MMLMQFIGMFGIGNFGHSLSRGASGYSAHAGTDDRADWATHRSEGGTGCRT